MLEGFVVAAQIADEFAAIAKGEFERAIQEVASEEKAGDVAIVDDLTAGDQFPVGLEDERVGQLGLGSGASARRRAAVERMLWFLIVPFS